MRQREADGVDGSRVERELACDTANAVGAKELLHRIFLRIYYQACCGRVAVRLLSQAGPVSDGSRILIAVADLRSAVCASKRR